MYTLYICRMLNVTMCVYALENCKLEKVLNITYNSFAISVVSSFNINLVNRNLNIKEEL